MKETIIYGLIDPRTSELRYVGKTTQGMTKRLKEHRYDAVIRNSSMYSSKWLRTIYENGLKPMIEIFEIVLANGDWVEAEKRWIAHWRMSGARLTNLTDGGEGLAGLKRSQHVIDAVRVANLGSKKSEEAKIKMRAAWTPKRRAAMSALKRGIKYSDIVRRRMSDSAKKRFRSCEERAACAERLKKCKRNTPEILAKQSISLKASWAKNPERRTAASLRAKEVLSRPESRAKQGLTLRGRKPTEKQLACLALGWNRKKNATSIHRG